MPQTVNSLEGQVISLTGRFSSLTHSQIVELIQERGGRYGASLTQKTTHLIVGDQALPLRNDGRLTRKLQEAQKRIKAGANLEILSEDEWLRTLSVTDEDSPIRHRYRIDQLIRLSGVSRHQLQSWIELGIIEPVERVQGLDYFDFQQVAIVKMLERFHAAGIKTSRLRKSLEQLKTWLPDATKAVRRLDLWEGQLALQQENGKRVEPTGQILLEFDSRNSTFEKTTVAFEPPQRDLFAEAVYFEKQAQFEEAADVYYEWLMIHGSDPLVCFNLANVLTELGRLDGAVERYRQALEIDCEFAEAWNNLGLVLADLDRSDEARHAWHSALKARPDYPEAYYNLADSLSEVGAFEEAKEYWAAYLSLCESEDEWTDHARSCLECHSA